MRKMENIIEMRNITISFGSLVANRDVSFDLRRGEIVALLGENGAGKSTLMKILYGLYTRDSGTITVDGREMPKRYSPLEAIALGISMVPQQFMLVDAFTVAENIVLGEEKALSRFLFNKGKAEEKVRQLCEQYGITVSPSSEVSTLPLGVKQKIEILKALYRGSKVLILDEPTTVLTPQEVQELFVLLRSLQSQGISVILIAHKLQEVMDVSDRIIVMRQGERVASVQTKNTDLKELARTMVGRDLEEVCVHRNQERIPPSFRLCGVKTKKEGERCNLKGVDLDLYPGRIVGVAGIDGNGQTELVEVIGGIKKLLEGTIETPGGTITENSIETMRKLGIGIIPENRREQGLVLDLSVRDNIIVGQRRAGEFQKGGIFKMKLVNEYTDRLIREFDIRPQNRGAICRFISGGNQQKIVLSRELSKPGLQLVVASQPIRGLDVGAIEFTHSMLLRFREEGKSVLLVSSDLDEIRKLSDYIAVISDGKIAACKPSAEFTMEEIGLYMGGQNRKENAV